MAEAAQRLKANTKLAGNPCGHCGNLFGLGEDAARCNACSSYQHAACWDSAGGCSNAACLNAPLKRMDPPPVPPGFGAAPAGGAPGQKACPHCGKWIPEQVEQCYYCNGITTADGLYHGPKQNAPGAVAALVYGLVGLAIFGLILGIVAIAKSNQARAAIRQNPMYSGSGLATAGLVLGIIDIIAWAIILATRFSH